VTDQHVGNRSEVLEPFEDFVRRHVGPSAEEQEGMLKVLGYETLDALEAFHPARVAARILDMGDVVGLVERAAENFDKEQSEKLAKKMKKGEFDMNDLADQLRQMAKLGGMQGVLSMLPGVGKVKDQLAGAGLDDKMLKRQEAIISSMTKKERVKPDIINGSRRKRIASGAGVEVSDVNKLLKMHRQMSDVMKKIGKGGRNPFGGFGGGMPQLPPGMFPGGRR